MQDFLTSAFLLTGRDCFYTREAAAELVAAMCDALGGVDLPQPALLKPLQLWTGKQLMSALIRPSTRMQCAPRPVTRLHVAGQMHLPELVGKLMLQQYMESLFCRPKLLAGALYMGACRLCFYANSSAAADMLIMLARRHVLPEQQYMRRSLLSLQYPSTPRERFAKF